MRLVYLAQGSAERLKRLVFPDDAIVYVLCYDRDTTFAFARQTIHDPRCSWAEGRNRLAEFALVAHPDVEYLIFADDDVVFLIGSFACPAQPGGKTAGK